MKPSFNYHGHAHKLPKDDKRLKRFAKQRRTRGFDDTETWCLHDSIASYTLPRLRHFRDHTGGHPGALTQEEWTAIVGKMVTAFEIIRQEDVTDKEWKTVQRGLNLFAKWYMHLWS